MTDEESGANTDLSPEFNYLTLSLLCSLSFFLPSKSMEKCFVKKGNTTGNSGILVKSMKVLDLFLFKGRIFFFFLKKPIPGQIHGSFQNSENHDSVPEASQWS